MVRAGWAFPRGDFTPHDPKRFAELCSIEKEAREAKRGAWSGTFDIPFVQKGGGRRKTKVADVTCPGFPVATAVAKSGEPRKLRAHADEGKRGPDESEFWWNWSIAAVSALATLAAVIVALFGNWIVARLWPPLLSIRLQDSTCKTVETLLEPGITLSRWCHIRVENRRRWAPVTDVRVLLQRLERADAAGQLQTSWMGEVPLRWSHQSFKPPAIAIGRPEEADLISVTKNPSSGPHILQLHPLFRSHSLQATWNSACKLAVTLQARGVEGDSNTLRVEIIWDGQWSDDAEQMKRQLVITEATLTTGGRRS
jgi:hypothetical protein